MSPRRRLIHLMLAVLGPVVVGAIPLSLPGCGAGASDHTEVVVPKVPVREAAKDSINESLKLHMQKSKGARR